MEGVVRKDSDKPGKIVAIIGGVHGNETVGIEALRWAQETITPEYGSIYFINGNPEAVKRGVRFVEKNLNRCFREEVKNELLEEARARELMPILAECDASLDIHASSSKVATPFVICERSGLDLAHSLEFPIVSTGWDALEPGGTDNYVNSCGNMGITIECGSVHYPEETLQLAKDSILQFLRYTGILNGELLQRSIEQRHVHVHFVGHKDERPVSFVRDYADFEALTPGEVFATQGTEEYVAQEGDCIIFPRPNAPIGAEVFILGRAQ